MMRKLTLSAFVAGLCLSGWVWHAQRQFSGAPEGTPVATDGARNLAGPSGGSLGAREFTVEVREGSALNPDPSLAPLPQKCDTEELNQSALEASTLLTNTEEFLLPFTRRWAETNAAAAAGWVESLPGGPLRAQMLKQVASTWANTELDAAVQWAESLPDDDKFMVCQVLSTEAARTAPLIAVRLSGALPAGPERDGALEHAVTQWAALDAQTSAEWVSQIADERLRERLMASIAIASAEKEGASAAQMVATLLKPGPEQNRAALAVAQRWAQTDPNAAGDWVQDFSEPQVRAAALESIAGIARIAGEPPPEDAGGAETE